jgi:hypothetical protein
LAALVLEALEMSKNYGNNSPEAGLAWEAVEEEVKSNDNSEAMKGSLDDGCDVDEYYGAASKACLEYNLQPKKLLCSKSLSLSRICYLWLRMYISQ